MSPLAEPPTIAPPIFKWSECDPRDAPENSYLVAGLIPVKGCHLVIGAPKAGKSQLTAYIVACLLSGRSVFDYYNVLPDAELRILWLLLEETRFKVRDRIEANLRGMGLTEDAIAELACRFEERIVISARDKSPERPVSDMIFSVPRHSRWLLNSVSQGEYNIVIVDSLRPAHGYEENSSTEMKPVTDLMRELSEYGCGLILHHRGHANPEYARIGGDAGRGTSDLDAARDTAIHIQKGKFGDAMLIGFHHRDDAERFVAVQTTVQRNPDIFTWRRLGESEDPGAASYMLQEAVLFARIDAAAQPEDLPRLSNLKTIFGDDYRAHLCAMDQEGLIQSRKLTTGRPGQNPTMLMRPGQFTDAEWAEAEQRMREES
jgi:hypothetical protein